MCIFFEDFYLLVSFYVARNKELTLNFDYLTAKETLNERMKIVFFST